MIKDAAMELLKKKGISSRILREDGNSFMTTMDYDPTRINVEIDKGSITKIKLG